MGDHVLWKGHERDSSSSSGSKDTSSSSRVETSLEGIEIVQSSGSSGDSSKQQRESQSRERVTNPLEGNSSASIVQKERDVLHRPDMEKLMSMPYERLVEFLPRDDEGNPGSIGSIDHYNGKCNPCAFMKRSRGCKQAVYCGFCHFPHSEKTDKVHRPSHNRPRKAERMRFQQSLDVLKSQVEVDPRKFNVDDVQFEPSIEGNTKKKEKVKAILKDYQHQAIALNAVDKHDEDTATQRKTSL